MVEQKKKNQLAQAHTRTQFCLRTDGPVPDFGGYDERGKKGENFLIHWKSYTMVHIIGV